MLINIRAAYLALDVPSLSHVGSASLQRACNVTSVCLSIDCNN